MGKVLCYLHPLFPSSNLLLSSANDTSRSYYSCITAKILHKSFNHGFVLISNLNYTNAQSNSAPKKSKASKMSLNEFLGDTSVYFFFFLYKSGVR